MNTRLIENCPDLPLSFAVIESASYTQAIADMKMAFSNPDKHLVVWNKPANLRQSGIKDIGSAISSETETIETRISVVNFLTKIFSSDTSRLHIKHTQLFNKFASKSKIAPELLQAWRTASAELMEALYTELNPKIMQSALRLRQAGKDDAIHRDIDIVSNLVVVSCTLGERTQYFDPKETKFYSRPKLPPLIKAHPDATRWIPADNAVAFHSRFIRHTPASVAGGSPVGQWRALELHVLRTQPFIACHKG